MGDYYSQMKQRESISAANASFNEPPARLTFCVVTAVDIQNRSVTIKHAGSSLEETNISYTSLSANAKAGQDNIPSKGDVAVVASTATGTKIILGFVGGSNRSAEVSLREGDMLSKSLGDSIIKQDADGNFFICTKDGSHLVLTKSGNLKAYASSMDIETPFFKISEGEVENTPFQKKEIFGKKPRVAGTVNENMRLILEGEALSFEQRFSVLTEHLGGKVDSEGNLSLLDIGSTTQKEIVHSKEIRNKETGEVVFSEDIDSDGNMKIKGNIIVIDGLYLDSSTNFNLLKNRVTLNANTTSVPVDIPQWNPVRDILIVYVGGLYQANNYDYYVNRGERTIEGEWDEGLVFDFLVIKNARSGASAFLAFEQKVILASNATAVPIEIDEWNASRDILLVYVGGIYQVPELDYSADGFERMLYGSWDIGTEIDLMVIKNISGGLSDFYEDREQIILTEPTTTIPIGLAMWHPRDTILFVFVGGIYQTPGVEYTLNPINRTITGSWDTDTVIDFLVISNVEDYDPNIYLDGSILDEGSVTKDALSGPLNEEFNAIHDSIENLQTALSNAKPVGATLYLYKNVGGAF